MYNDNKIDSIRVLLLIEKNIIIQFKMEIEFPLMQNTNTECNNYIIGRVANRKDF